MRTATARLACAVACGAALCAGPWLAPRGARAAEGPTLDTLRYRAEVLPGGVLGVGGATVDPALALRGTLVVQGEHVPVLLVSDAERTNPVVRNRIAGELGLALGVGKGIAVWAGLPFIAYQSGWWPDPSSEINSWGPGDLRFGGTFRLLDPARYPVGVTLRPALQVPTGMRGAFASSGVVEGLAQVGIETRLGPVRVVGTLGARIRPPREWSGIATGSAFTYGAGAELRLHRRWHVGLAWVGEVAGVQWDNPMELRLGGNFEAHRTVRLGALLGFGLAPGHGTPDVRFGVRIDLAALPAGQASIAATEPFGGAGGAPGFPPPAGSADDAPPSAAAAPDAGGEVLIPLPPVSPLTFASASPSAARYQQLLLPAAVRFEPGETELDAAARTALGEVARYLATHPEVARVVVVGHGDGDGGDGYNTLLSRRRAVATRRFLVDEAGVAEALLAVPEADPADGVLSSTTAQARRDAVSFLVSRP